MHCRNRVPFDVMNRWSAKEHLGSVRTQTHLCVSGLPEEHVDEPGGEDLHLVPATVAVGETPIRQRRNAEGHRVVARTPDATGLAVSVEDHQHTLRRIRCDYAAVLE